MVFDLDHRRRGHHRVRDMGTRDFLFGIFIVIAEVLFIAWGNATPATVNFTLTENKLAIGIAKHYQIKLFENFSVNKLDDNLTEISLTFRTKLRTPLTVLLPSVKLEEARKDLKPLLREVEFEPSLARFP